VGSYRYADRNKSELTDNRPLLVGGKRDPGGSEWWPQQAVGPLLSTHLIPATMLTPELYERRLVGRSMHPVAEAHS